MLVARHTLAREQPSRRATSRSLTNIGSIAAEVAGSADAVAEERKSVLDMDDNRQQPTREGRTICRPPPEAIPVYDQHLEAPAALRAFTALRPPAAPPSNRPRTPAPIRSRQDEN